MKVNRVFESLIHLRSFFFSRMVRLSLMSRALTKGGLSVRWYDFINVCITFHGKSIQFLSNWKITYFFVRISYLRSKSNSAYHATGRPTQTFTNLRSLTFKAFLHLAQTLFAVGWRFVCEDNSLCKLCNVGNSSQSFLGFPPLQIFQRNLKAPHQSWRKCLTRKICNR